MTQAPMTLPAMIEQLRGQLEETEQEVASLTLDLARRREHAAYLRGRLESYASIQLIENPATLEHDQEASS